ncbi:MipA/OmpV family protein [Mesorhizobium sp. SB112]|uniref:MipA/OmpV family protein n=1 Tax=Mesorhizobium sp. SB112 TaxID=3151853 RepID=UPI00326598E8
MLCVKEFRPLLKPFAISAGLAVLAVTTGARAADVASTDQFPEPDFDERRFGPEPTKSKWSVIVGGGAMYEPEYEGSGDFKISPIPMIVINYGGWVEVDPRGLSVTVLEHSGFSFAGRLGYETGRGEDDHDMLRGLGDVNFAATVGARVGYNWGPLEFYAAIDKTVSRSESLIGTFGIDYSAPVTERLILGAGVSATVADDNHMESYFGINAAQSAASGLPQYEAKAGLKRVDFSATATYMVTDNWLVRGGAGLGILTADAADSPIVEEKIQPSVMFGVGYKF